jgi:hypothetical protein
MKLPEEKIEELKKDVEALYVYLDLYLDSMNPEEVDFWRNILEQIDPEFTNEK